MKIYSPNYRTCPFHKLENLLRTRLAELNLYIEYTGAGYLYRLLEYFKRIKKTKKDDKKNIAIFTVQLHKNLCQSDIIDGVSAFPQTITVEII